MFTARAALALACAGALALAACSSNGAASTTSPSPTPADATVSESFSTTVTVGGGVFYSFSIAQYGNVAVTLTGITGPDLPDGLTLGVGIGRPSGTSCATSSTVSATAGDTPQLTGVYGPGVFCVRVYDSGTLVGPVAITASVAHS
jgi:hypothetical protein